MAQVPMRLAQPGLVPPHHQRPPMMVSMTQPPPVSMQGLVSMAPMMGPGGGMAVMTQAMNHPESGHEHHTMNGPYHHPHPHHPHHRPQTHHPPPHHQSGPPPQPPHSQYHPHAGHTGPVHHNPGQHMSNISNTNGNTHAIPQQHLQSGHMNQPPHAMSHHSAPHQMTNMNTGTMPNHPHHQQQMNHQPQPMHQQMMSPSQPQQPSPQPPLIQHHHQAPPQPSPHDGITPGGIIVLSNGAQPNGTIATSIHSRPSCPPATSVPTNGILNTSSSSSLEALDSSDSLSTREKTPMCLINELARYNKIQHQYCLTDEKGPAHKKIFTVTLRLGDNEEEYSASGASIKKAQHSAAALALEKTKFKHPPPKTQRQSKQTKLTPTVELNALAMKRGEAAMYTFMETPRPPNPFTYNVPVPPNMRAVYSQKYYGRPTVYPMFFVTLKVGTREFNGEGATAQQAKHNAASKALKIIKTLPMPDANTTTTITQTGDLTLDPNADLKSPISLVHEIALKRNLTVAFEVIKESGPPHMRTFVTTCIVGDIRSQGEGTGKKISKKRAAELMLEELKKLPPAPAVALGRVKRKPTTKKKSRNLIKVGQEEQKAAPEYGQGINPISRLIQIQQAKKEKEPIYTLLAERGVPRRREFIMQVIVGENSAQGSGPNKKLAKRAAAESMLQLLGYSRPQPQPVKSSIKMDGVHIESDKTRKQVTFSEESTEPARVPEQNSIQAIPGGSGRQLVPGLIMMPDGSALHGYHQSLQQQSGMQMGSVNSMENIQTTAAIAKELLESGCSPTAKAMSMKTENTSVTSQQNSSPSTPRISNCQQQQQQPQPPPAAAAVTPHVQKQSDTTSSAQPLPSQAPTLSQQPNVQPSSSQIQSLTPPMTNSTPNRNGLTISGNTSGQAVRPKDQLMYLANILNLQVQFTDFPKGNKSEFLSLVSLSTTPPQVSHGAGPTTDASHDQACLNALKSLAEMGLDTVTSGNTPSSS